MTDFEIFKSCYPEFSLTEQLFDTLSEKNNCHIFREKGGTAYVNKNKIGFIAVAPEQQGKGTGRRLLKQCEEYIAGNGYDYVYAGGLFPGIPFKSRAFFTLNGYETQGERVEMGMDIGGFAADISRAPDGISFGFYKGEHNELIEAVKEVDEEWVQYFTNHETVFCGFKDGKAVSFCIVDKDVSCLLSDGKTKVGSIGCVGTVPAFRKQGIGLYMVELATELLAKEGSQKSFIHCTHLENWYGRLGYRTFLRYCAGRKLLK